MSTSSAHWKLVLAERTLTRAPDASDPNGRRHGLSSKDIGRMTVDDSKPTRGTLRKNEFMRRRAHVARQSERLWFCARAAAIAPKRRAVSADQLATLASRAGLELETNLHRLEQRNFDYCPYDEFTPTATAPPPMLPTVSTAYSMRLDYMLMIVAQVTTARAHAVCKRMNPEATRVSRKAMRLACASMANALAIGITDAYEP